MLITEICNIYVNTHLHLIKIQGKITQKRIKICTLLRMVKIIDKLIKYNIKQLYRPVHKIRLLKNNNSFVY